jgi:PKD repeat protein
MSSRITGTRIDTIMRTTQLSLMASLAAITMAACTVQDVETPPLSGPSSLARTIIMQADRDTLIQDGVQEAAIRLTAVVQPGQSENVRLRAQVTVDGVAQDFGTLSNKNPITPTTIFYRAPAAPTTAGGQLPTTVTIVVTPDDQGDFRGEFSRQLDIRLIPPGVILPTNPNLVSSFTFAPLTPQVMTVVTFNAAGSTNGGTACNTACTYTWDFGDGTTASGQAVTHQFRSVGNFQVRLTVTDNRGSQAVSVQTVPVAPGVPPTVTFTISPQSPGINQDVFFAASATSTVGRPIVKYDWTFGDGNSASGSNVTHRYTAPGQYSVQVTATDDAGAVGRATQTLTVGRPVGPTPVADLSCSPATPKPGSSVSCNAAASTPGSGANIVSYTFNWGDGSPEEVSDNPLQTHVFGAGTYVVTVTVRDSLGRTASDQVTFTVSP